MSKISDEKLVIAAVKGNNEAIKLLKNRAKSGIQTALEKGSVQGRENDIKVLESQVLEKVFDALSDYTFQSLSKHGYTVLLLTWLFSIKKMK